tara:strand:+ start:120 stop:653 length:534 start_codon:yes stop_codon:yes gene_type:complete
MTNKYKIKLKEICVETFEVDAKDFEEAKMLIENGEADRLEVNTETNYSIVSQQPTIINATDSADFEMVSHWGEIDGTSLQGYMDISFDEIEEILGKPNMTGDPYKVDAEWGIKFSDGTVATIYNYKTGRRYLGNEGLDVRDIRDWHIGGRNKSVVERVCKLLNTKALDYLTARYGGK